MSTPGGQHGDEEMVAITLDLGPTTDRDTGHQMYIQPTHQDERGRKPPHPRFSIEERLSL